MAEGRCTWKTRRLAADWSALDGAQTNFQLQLSTRIGSHGPMYCTGSGKALLAFLPDAERETLSAAQLFRAVTPHTITSLAALRRELQRTRERGYSLDHEEAVLGVHTHTHTHTPLTHTCTPPPAHYFLSAHTRTRHCQHCARRRPHPQSFRSGRGGDQRFRSLSPKTAGPQLDRLLQSLREAASYVSRRLGHAGEPHVAAGKVKADRKGGIAARVREKEDTIR